MTKDIVVQVKNIWKQYGLPLPEMVAKIRRTVTDKGQSAEDHWALRNISFEIGKGETLGIIGANGAGKSTLLKILAGVTPATRGKVSVTGRVFPMIELSAGIHPELTGRENVRLLQAIMGFSRKEIESRMEQIEEFCELADWFNRPVWMYSSGMLARLGFGVAVNVDADVLLVDEVLAVGDFAFQKKCIERMTNLNNSGVAILFVSHNPYRIERMCDKVIVLKAGEVEALNNPKDAIHRYFSMGIAEQVGGGPGDVQEPSQRPGTGDMRILSVDLLDASAQTVTKVFTGEPLIIRLYYKTTMPLWEPNIGIRIFDPQNTLVMSCVSTAGRAGRKLSGEGYIECRINRLPLMPNLYTIDVKAAAEIVYDLYEDAARFNVSSDPETILSTGNAGIVYAPIDWHYGVKT
jgi:ABC-type polysaccharide/polyol phosphate transport system ATPase subunit